MLAVGPIGRREAGREHYVFWCQPFLSEVKPHLLPEASLWLKSQLRLQDWRHIPEASFPFESPSLIFGHESLEKAAKEDFRSLLLRSVLHLLFALFFLGDFLPGKEAKL